MTSAQAKNTIPDDDDDNNNNNNNNTMGVLHYSYNSNVNA
jgi:hypothetical protein